MHANVCKSVFIPLYVCAEFIKSGRFLHKINKKITQPNWVFSFRAVISFGILHRNRQIEKSIQPEIKMLTWQRKYVDKQKIVNEDMKIYVILQTEFNFLTTFVFYCPLTIVKTNKKASLFKYTIFVIYFLSIDHCMSFKFCLINI